MDDSFYGWLLKLDKELEVQVKLTEDLFDRVAALEECARVTPTKDVRQTAKTKNKDQGFRGQPEPDLELPF